LLRFQLKVTSLLVKHGGFSYESVMRMPLMHRHAFLDMLQQENEENNRRLAGGT
jgi:hypothetical protein